MKVFSYIITIIMLFALALLFYDSGISAREDLYIQNVVLKDKASNTIESNRDEIFLGRVFSLNNLAYMRTPVGTINYNETLLINGENVDINLVIDIYQTMPLVFEDQLKYYFHGVISEFNSSLDEFPTLRLTGHYETLLLENSNTTSYFMNDFDFPIFGLNNTITNSEINLLNSLVIEYRNTELFEIVLNEAIGIKNKYHLKDFDNYPSDLLHFYNTFENTLDIKSGGYKTPTEEQIKQLNQENYNFHILKSLTNYNYVIFVYLGIYFIIFGLIVYNVFIKKLIRKRKKN